MSTIIKELGAPFTHNQSVISYVVSEHGDVMALNRRTLQYFIYIKSINELVESSLVDVLPTGYMGNGRLSRYYDRWIYQAIDNSNQRFYQLMSLDGLMWVVSEMQMTGNALPTLTQLDDIEFVYEFNYGEPDTHQSFRCNVFTNEVVSEECASMLDGRSYKVTHLSRVGDAMDVRIIGKSMADFAEISTHEDPEWTSVFNTAPDYDEEGITNYWPSSNKIFSVCVQPSKVFIKFSTDIVTLSTDKKNPFRGSRPTTIEGGKTVNSFSMSINDREDVVIDEGEFLLYRRHGTPHFKFLNIRSPLAYSLTNDGLIIFDKLARVIFVTNLELQTTLNNGPARPRGLRGF